MNELIKQLSICTIPICAVLGSHDYETGEEKLLITPMNHFKPDVVFHGHAHHGTFEGKTSDGIPVYNVSVPIVTKKNNNIPYHILEV